MNDWTEYLSFLFTKVLILSYSSVMNSEMLGEEGLWSLWENLVWRFSANFIPFFFACIEATDPISQMFVFAEMFTALKGLEIFSSPAITLHYS